MIPEDTKHQFSGAGSHRVFGFCGMSDPAAVALAASSNRQPGSTVVGRLGRSVGLDAFGLVAPHVSSAGHATTAGGSFMMIDGRFHASGTDIHSVLNEWLVDGVSTFRRHQFHGFIAAWNADSHVCMLLRDQFGISPGYVAEGGDGFVFSTDIDSLLRAGVDPSPDPEAFDAFIAAGYFPAPLTPIAAITKLPPGHTISITPDGV
jgi:hypothetical protein